MREIELTLSPDEEISMIENRKLTWPDGTPITVGDAVRCERAAPSKGTWPRCAGRTGRVVRVVEWLCHADEKVWVGEIGVELDSAGPFWFKPTELARLVPLSSRHRVVTPAGAAPDRRGQSRRQTAKKQLADLGISK